MHSLCDVYLGVLAQLVGSLDLSSFEPRLPFSQIYPLHDGRISGDVESLGSRLYASERTITQSGTSTQTSQLTKIATPAVQAFCG